MDKIVNLAKSRGFIFPSSEIYGGFQGVYDYGPLGVELLKNIKNSWWRAMVQMQEDIVGLDSQIFMDPKVWVSSGHVSGFSDPFIEKDGEKKRADHLLEEIGVYADPGATEEEFIKLWDENKDKLDVKGWSEPKYKNLLVESNLGDEKVYLRGETCQGIYVNFKNVLNSTHMKLPFGIAQIGKAFRNEISPRQFIFRTREFEQMEMQFFTYEEKTKEAFDRFLKLRLDHLVSIGLDKDKLRVSEHDKLIFYAKRASDIEYNYSFGWKELEGVHDRGNYDLTQHSEGSGEKLTYYDQDKDEHILPSIVETSIGCGRLFLALMSEAYDEEKLEDGTDRVVLRFKKEMAPIKVSILPLQKKAELTSKAKEIFNQLNQEQVAMYDDTGSIGKRYRRQDEIGTPYCITVDFETLEDGSVTIRDRDTMKQDRVKIENIKEYINS